MSETKTYTTKKTTVEERQHREFVAAVINRFSVNGMRVKMTGLLLVSMLTAFGIVYHDTGLILIALGQTSFFWFLDAYNLNKERGYRFLYTDIVSRERPGHKAYCMDASAYCSGFKPYFSAFFSRTIAPIYITLLTTCTLYLLGT